ncbi:MAG: stage V sporulation protein AC [Eubacteriales bacterium]|nr:stage V sporulation protein AC [Eubacteriales bacterium]
MELTPKEYQSMVEKASDPSPLWKDMVVAFLSGGAICLFGQLILNGWKNTGLEQKDAAAATSITLIAIAALLTGMHLYDKIAKHAGAGTLVPITGFSNSIASAALEFKSEGLILGTAAKMFTIAGPVLVFGISSSVLYGVILYLAGMF